MSEEEILINIKEMINICDSLPNEECTAHIISHDHFKAVKGLLDLYNKQKEEIKELKRDYEIITDDMKNHNVVYTDMPEFEERYVSKDKLLKEIEILENKVSDENYWRLTDTQFTQYCYGIILLRRIMEG